MCGAFKYTSLGSKGDFFLLSLLCGVVFLAGLGLIAVRHNDARGTVSIARCPHENVDGFFLITLLPKLPSFPCPTVT